jgi:hypothetical protein
MRVGVFFFGGVEIDDAGAGLPAPMSRRYEQKDFWHAQERLLDMGKVSTRRSVARWLTVRRTV